MFERYTEAARRTVFAARNAAFPDSKYIETHHLLLGLIHTDAPLFARLLGSETAVADLQGEAGSTSPLNPVADRSSATLDIPFSNECRRVVSMGMHEADDLRDLHIGTEHLLLAILRHPECLAAQMLARRGVELESVRRKVRPDSIRSQRCQISKTIKTLAAALVFIIAVLYVCFRTFGFMWFRAR